MARRKKHLVVMQEYRERTRALGIPDRDECAAGLLAAFLEAGFTEGWGRQAARDVLIQLIEKGFDGDEVKRKFRDMKEALEKKKRVHAQGGIKRAEEAF